MKKLLFLVALAAAIALGTGGAYALENDRGTYDRYDRGMQNERPDAVQSATQPYICDVPGCTQNNPHSHDYCTVSGCENDWGTYDGGYGRGMQNERPDAVQSATQPYICDVPGCTQNNPHSHDYCAVSGCGQMTWCEHDDIIYNNNGGGNRFGYGRCHR